MTIVLQIPESITSAIRLPEQIMETELKSLFALTLYSQGLLSFGKAREFAGLNKYKFSLLLGENKIPRHYEEPDLADDIEYARNNK
ncbi:MAG TPA: UPF0175 family protein [Leptospiraceae bacterium]|nr:UPF0175 family protein [Leptospiraceae bacterium]HRG76210.1 UPF0175 family protein [Leptospiraceae bacterium]